MKFRAIVVGMALGLTLAMLVLKTASYLKYELLTCPHCGSWRTFQSTQGQDAGEYRCLHCRAVWRWTHRPPIRAWEVIDGIRDRIKGLF